MNIEMKLETGVVVTVNTPENAIAILKGLAKKTEKKETHTAKRVYRKRRSSQSNSWNINDVSIVMEHLHDKPSQVVAYLPSRTVSSIGNAQYNIKTGKMSQHMRELVTQVNDLKSSVQL